MNVRCGFPNRRRSLARGAAALLMVTAVLPLTPRAGAQAGISPIVPEGTAKQASPHVWMITSFPNIVIIVGDHATMVVDTGLGERNGEIVAREAKRLSKPGARLYLTTTHFHPEHAAGDQGFPAGTIILRDMAQQKELEEQGAQVVERFRGINSFASCLRDKSFARPTSCSIAKRALI